MTVLSRGARSRRGGRRPGWALLTVLLVLAIGASSALVFTNRVELLKLAVILSLWAAVVAAFVSVIYRRQSDIDAAKARDLKLVYDLQLDREISARREYELALENQLRRELTEELRARQADEVAALRAELAALRTNLEILFDADLSHRPELETERTTVRAYSERARDDEPPRPVGPSLMEDRTEESPIIDVAAEPHPPEPQWPAPQPGWAAPEAGWPRDTGSGPAQPQPARSEPVEPEPVGRRHARAEFQAPPPAPQPQTPRPQPRATEPAAPEPPAPEPAPAADTGWRPAPAEGRWIPAGQPGSNWSAPVEPEPAEPAPTAEYVGRRRAPEPEPGQPRGRHYKPADAAAGAPAAAAPRHRGPDDDAPSGQHAGGQPVSELLARLRADTGTTGGRRRRRGE